MIRLAGEYGVSQARCIAGTALTRDDLADPMREIGGLQELAVLRNILRSVHPSVPFGFLAGLRYHSTTHGMWGFAVMSSPDTRTAIAVGLRYFELSFSFNRLGFEVEGRQARLFWDDTDNPDDLRAALVERDVGALVTLERELVGYVEPAQALSFRAPRPAYPDPFQPLFGVPSRYGADVNCVAFDMALLDTPQLLADARGLRVGEDKCRELIERRHVDSGFTGRVRSRIVRDPGTFPDMPTVATEFGMSTRTLRNRLGREATSYRALVDEVRQMLAEQLLASEMTIDAIAERLGYNDTSSFIAAFKRWKGVPPRRYKEELSARSQSVG